MIIIDGSQGEGGGQILRSSLALSMVTGRPVRIEKIREKRPKPGLLRQHLTAVTAAARVCNAEVPGAALGSRQLEFRPQAIVAGDYRFSIGSAGSTTLVLQTILPALMTADGASTVRLEGGTHNPHAPPFEFLQKAFLPIVARMGPRVTLELERPGFFPAGGGRFKAFIEPVQRAAGDRNEAAAASGASSLNPGADQLSVHPQNLNSHRRDAGATPAPPAPGRTLERIELNDRGEICKRMCRAVVAGLDRNIAEREIKVIRKGLNWPPECFQIEELDLEFGPGNILMIELVSEHVTEVFTGFGMRGVQAEAVAEDALEQTKRYLAAGVPVGPCLADQLLLPMALAGGGSFTTLPLTRHSRTNIEIIQKFLAGSVDVARGPSGQSVVTLGSPVA